MEEKKAKLIVVVEDEDTLANIMQMKLEKAGYRVAVGRNGEEGLHLIHTMKPDLVLLDLLLPVKNGYSVLQELHDKNILPGLPVIVISNSGQAIEIERILKFGIRDYLIKLNFSPYEVLSKVEQVLSGGGQGNSHTVRHTASVLIVEDDLILVDLLERKFREKFNVHKAVNVNEAKRIIASVPLDAILLDIVLPDVDGFTFLAELKQAEATKKIPVVVISNLGQKEEIERGMKLGAAGYVIKANALPQEIIQKVESIIGT